MGDDHSFPSGFCLVSTSSTGGNVYKEKNESTTLQKKYIDPLDCTLGIIV